MIYQRRNALSRRIYIKGLSLYLTRLPGETDLETIASLTPARKAAARRKKSAAA